MRGIAPAVRMRAGHRLAPVFGSLSMLLQKSACVSRNVSAGSAERSAHQKAHRDDIWASACLKAFHCAEKGRFQARSKPFAQIEKQSPPRNAEYARITAPMCWGTSNTRGSGTSKKIRGKACMASLQGGHLW